MQDLFSLQGKTAIVTGGSGGIGAMIAEGFVKNGVKTYITARDEDRLDVAVANFSKHGVCIGIRSDLSTLAGVKEFVRVINQHETMIHIVVNNAGATWGEKIDTFPEKGWDKVMDLNVKSVFFLTQHLLPSLRNAGSHEDPARVVNIGSINGFTHPHTHNYSYSASKAAVHHLTRQVGADLARDKINVNGIAPGVFPSRMTAHMLIDEAEVIRSIPRGRLGTAEDIAGAAIFLCSRASAWMTGHTLILDGGQVALS